MTISGILLSPPSSISWGPHKAWSPSASRMTGIPAFFKSSLTRCIVLASLDIPGPITNASASFDRSSMSSRLSKWRDPDSVSATGKVIVSVSFCSKTGFRLSGQASVTSPAPDLRAPRQAIAAAPVYPTEPATMSSLPTSCL